MLTVRYALTREELLTWTKEIIRRGFWVYLVGGPVIACTVFAWLGIGGSSLSGVIWGLAYGAVLASAVVFWPQVRYRAEERVLQFSEDGITSTRGKQTVRVPWKNIHSVSDEAVGVVIARRNYNALIIPRRALGDEAAATATFRKIASLHSAGR